MKKYLGFSLLFLLFLAAVAGAIEYKADLSLKTGDAELDLHLKDTNDLASTPTGRTEADKYLARNYFLSEKEIVFLHQQGYSVAEIEYLALLAKKSGKPVNKIVALRSQGVGWGVLAKRLGVQPGTLRKLIVHHRKIEKMEKKHKMMNEHNLPMNRGGGSKGRGR